MHWWINGLSISWDPGTEEGYPVPCLIWCPHPHEAGSGVPTLGMREWRLSQEKKLAQGQTARCKLSPTEVQVSGSQSVVPQTSSLGIVWALTRNTNS